MYCRMECPIGKMLPLKTEVRGLENITVRLLNSLDEEAVRRIRKTMLMIAADGEIRKEGKEDFKEVVSRLDEIFEQISEVRMYAEKYLEG